MNTLDRNIRSIITKRALELAKTTIDKSKIAKALVDRIVNKEHLASQRTVYRALEDERFAEFKDEKHVAVRKGAKSRCHVASTSTTTTTSSEQLSRQQLSTTNTSPLPQQHPVYTLERKPEEQLPQWILDARQAIEKGIYKQLFHNNKQG